LCSKWLYFDWNPKKVGFTDAGENFALAHAPGRVMVGRLLRNTREHDRVVSGIDEVSTARAVELSSPVLVAGTVIPWLQPRLR